MPQGTAAPLSSRLLLLLVVWLAVLGAGLVLSDPPLVLLPAKSPAGAAAAAAAAAVGVVDAAGPLAVAAHVAALP